MITCSTCKARFATLAEFDAHSHAAPLADIPGYEVIA